MQQKLVEVLFILRQGKIHLFVQCLHGWSAATGEGVKRRWQNYRYLSASAIYETQIMRTRERNQMAYRRGGVSEIASKVRCRKALDETEEDSYCVVDVM